jgi:hypothetical protein
VREREVRQRVVTLTRDVPTKLGGQREQRRMGGERGDIVTDGIEKNYREMHWETFYRGNAELK